MIPLIAGVGSTVIAEPVPESPSTVTTTFPVVAPAGTTVVMVVSLQKVGVAAVPLNFTVLVPWVAPKLAPVIVTVEPTAPDDGLIPLIAGMA